MQPLVQYGNHTNFTIAKLFPVNEVLLVAEQKTIDTELGRNGARHHLMCCDLFKGLEQASDAGVGLYSPPPVTGVLIDFVIAKRSRFLNANICQWLKPGFVQ